MSADPTTLSAVELARAYRQGALRPTAVTAAYLNKAAPGPIYRELLSDRALAQAERAERQFESGVDVGPLQGIPVAVKDLIDVEGTVTVAGSPALALGEPAAADAPALARLDAAGAVFLGKTNMTELAFSGIGINPHYGTPANRFDPERVPGGSSSGSAAAVAYGLACAAVGSDTGGSVRIPAAFNGLVGLKTSEGAIPTDGCTPLSVTLDTLGPITRDIGDAWLLYRALAALPPAPLPQPPVRLRLAAPTTVLHDSLDPRVEAGFAAGLERLERLGHEVVRLESPILGEIEEAIGRYGSLASHEAFAMYEELIEERGDLMDPRVSRRILAVRGRPSSDYLRLLLSRRGWQRRFWAQMQEFDAVVAPTVAILPPRVSDLAEDASYYEANRLCLRNTTIFNYLGGASLSVPVEAQSPVGLMISGPPSNEGLLLAIGRLFETVGGD
ncbi:MAG TPA: amidase family protein [Trueperaceae bacterium]